jgi:hypothetical protein
MTTYYPGEKYLSSGPGVPDNMPSTIGVLTSDSDVDYYSWMVTPYFVPAPETSWDFSIDCEPGVAGIPSGLLILVGTASGTPEAPAGLFLSTMLAVAYNISMRGSCLINLQDPFAMTDQINAVGIRSIPANGDTESAYPPVVPTTRVYNFSWYPLVTSVIPPVVAPVRVGRGTGLGDMHGRQVSFPGGR